jgi:hypothetical protein
MSLSVTDSAKKARKKDLPYRMNVGLMPDRPFDRPSLGSGVAQRL